MLHTEKSYGVHILQKKRQFQMFSQRKKGRSAREQTTKMINFDRCVFSHNNFLFCVGRVIQR